MSGESAECAGWPSSVASVASAVTADGAVRTRRRAYHVGRAGRVLLAPDGDADAVGGGADLRLQRGPGAGVAGLVGVERHRVAGEGALAAGEIRGAHVAVLRTRRRTRRPSMPCRPPASRRPDRRSAAAGRRTGSPLRARPPTRRRCWRRRRRSGRRRTRRSRGAHRRRAAPARDRPAPAAAARRPTASRRRRGPPRRPGARRRRAPPPSRARSTPPSARTSVDGPSTDCPG